MNTHYIRLKLNLSRIECSALKGRPETLISSTFGKYVITEKQAPHGMALQTEPHTVELVYAGQEVTVTELRADMYNERQRVEISLVKTMETDTL